MHPPYRSGPELSVSRTSGDFPASDRLVAQPGFPEQSHGGDTGLVGHLRRNASRLARNRRIGLHPVDARQRLQRDAPVRLPGRSPDAGAGVDLRRAPVRSVRRGHRCANPFQRGSVTVGRNRPRRTVAILDRLDKLASIVSQLDAFALSAHRACERAHQTRHIAVTRFECRQTPAHNREAARLNQAAPREREIHSAAQRPTRDISRDVARVVEFEESADHPGRRAGGT